MRKEQESRPHGGRAVTARPWSTALHLTAPFAAVAASAVKQSCRAVRGGKVAEAQLGLGWAGAWGSGALPGHPRQSGHLASPAAEAGPRGTAPQEGVPQWVSPRAPGGARPLGRSFPRSGACQQIKSSSRDSFSFGGRWRPLEDPGWGSGVGAGS